MVSSTKPLRRPAAEKACVRRSVVGHLSILGVLLAGLMLATPAAAAGCRLFLSQPVID